MPDAIPDAIYYDRTVSDYCMCSAIQETIDDEQRVVLFYLGSGSVVTVPLGAFRDTESIDVRHVPGEPEEEHPMFEG